MLSELKERVAKGRLEAAHKAWKKYMEFLRENGVLLGWDEKQANMHLDNMAYHKLWAGQNHITKG